MFTVGNNIVVFPEAGQMIVKTEDPVIAKALQALPYVQLLPGQTQLLAALPWCEESCRIFSNVGIDATGAAPFFHDARMPLVEGKYQAMPHQLFTAAFITLNPRCYVLNDPRTGKTGSLILAIDYMQRQRAITGGVLVLTTVTTMPDVWAQGIRDTLPNAKVVIAHGPKRETILEDWADFYVSNYDSARISAKAFQAAVSDGRIGAVIIDELTHVGNVTTGRHKGITSFVNKLNMKYVIGATGSPGDNPETVYGMAKMINPGKLPCTTKAGWKDLVYQRYGSEPWQVRPSPQAPMIIHKTLQPAIRFAKSQVLNLPPVTTQNRTFTLSPEQDKMRGELTAKAIALAKSGETITAANAGVLYGKLLQVAQGFAIDTDGKPIYLEHDARNKTIIEAIGETQSKSVVACFYKARIARLQKEIEKAGYTVGVVDGSITGAARAEVIRKFQDTRDPHVLVVNVVAVAFGVDLARADTLILDGPPPAGQFNYSQLLERLSSAKQKAASINIIRVMGSPEEKKAFKALDNGRETGYIINTLFEEYRRNII